MGQQQLIRGVHFLSSSHCKKREREREKDSKGAIWQMGRFEKYFNLKEFCGWVWHYIVCSILGALMKDFSLQCKNYTKF